MSKKIYLVDPADCFFEEVDEVETINGKVGAKTSIVASGHGKLFYADRNGIDAQFFFVKSDAIEYYENELKQYEGLTSQKVEYWQEKHKRYKAELEKLRRSSEPNMKETKKGDREIIDGIPIG